LDFLNFVTTGPQTASIAGFGTVKTKNGNPTSSGNAFTQSTASQCLTDTFSVSTSGGGGPPAICGVNTGEHSELSIMFVHRGFLNVFFSCFLVYLDADQDCNTLAFQFGTGGLAGQPAVAQRAFNIKVFKTL